MKKRGAYIGRFNPLHLGHAAIVGEMLAQCGAEDSILIIGSSNAPFSLRHFFSYDERKKFIRAVYPDIRIVGLPDYPSDAEWLSALDDILAAAGMKPSEVTFFGGCEEDIRFFMDDGRACSLMNRFDGTTPKVSATEVRDALIHDRPLEGLVHPSVAADMRELFKEKWERFKKI